MSSEPAHREPLKVLAWNSNGQHIEVVRLFCMSGKDAPGRVTVLKKTCGLGKWGRCGRMSDRKLPTCRLRSSSFQFQQLSAISPIIARTSHTLLCIRDCYDCGTSNEVVLSLLGAVILQALSAPRGAALIACLPTGAYIIFPITRRLTTHRLALIAQDVFEVGRRSLWCRVRGCEQE